jgi:superfamily II DNA or RNA helicase
MEDKLLPYQIQHVNSLYNTLILHKRALDASDTGTGKTYTTIYLCKKLNLIPFIVCPKSVISTWLKVLHYFDYNDNEFILTTYNQLLKHHFIKQEKINNDDINFKWNFTNIDKMAYLFIYDEAHKCKNKDTINAKVLINLSDCGVNIILLSATIADKPLYFIILGYVLKLYTSFNDGLFWLDNVINSGKKSKHPLLGVHNVLYPKYASRMRVDDLENMFKDNKINFDGIYMENYFEIEREYGLINKMMEQTSTDKKNLGNIQKIRQKIENFKIDTIVKLTFNYLKEGKNVAIFVNFTNTINELSKKLGTKCIIYGNQTVEERSKNIEEFCSDKSRIIICNIQSGGSGISLHDTIGNYPRVSLISPTWSAQDLLQVLGRIHRATGKTDVVQNIIFCKNTIEENIGNVIKNKINNIRVLNDGSKVIKKNDNLEKICKIENIKKKKIEEKKLQIYQTNDFDNIQNRLDNLYDNKAYLENKLKKLIDKDNILYRETEYKLEKLNEEIKQNEDYLTKCLNNLINN